MYKCIQWIVSGFFIAFFCQNSIAARDPIAWSASQTLPAVINSPQSIIYTFTNNTTHRLVKSLTIEKQASPASEFTFTDTCTGSFLLPNASCTVTVNLTPNISGVKEAYLTIAHYSDNRVPLYLKTIYDNSSSHSSVTVTQNTGFYSPANQGAVLPFLFTFQNLGTVDATSATLTVIINGATAPSSAYSTTCGSTLTKNGGTCTVSGNYTVLGSPNTQTLSASLSYSGATGSPVATSTSTTLSAGSGVSVSQTPGLYSPSSAGDVIPFTFTFTNNNLSTDASSLILSVNINGSPAPTSAYSTTCTSTITKNGGTCTVTGNYTALASPSTQTIEASLTYAGPPGSPASSTTSTTLGSGLGVTVTQNPGLTSPSNVGDSIPFSFTFTNLNTTTDATSASLVVEFNNVPVTPPDYTTTCGTTLTQNGGTCTVSGNYTVAATPNSQTVSASLSYSGPPGSPASSTTTTTISSSSSGDLTGSWVGSNYLPPIFSTGTFTLQGLFTATTSVTIGSSTTVTCTDVTASSDCSAAISSIDDTSCVNQSISAGASCQVQFNLNTSTFTNNHQYTVTISVPNSGTPNPSTLSSTGSYVTSLPQYRTVKVVNNCTFPVWWSLSGGATGASISSCPTGQTSNGTFCYWNNPQPSPVNYQLTSGGSSYVQIPLSQNYQNIVWSGTISASLNCDGSTACLQAGCNNAGGSTSCAVGQGFTPPVTQAEITMLYQGVDSYDVEVINGYHIPISMAPANFDDNGNVISNITASNYNCGIPGNYQASNGFGACNWAGVSLGSGVNNIPGYGYIWVSGTQTIDDTTNCNIATPTNNCPSGNICGLNNNLKQVCGEFYGFWSADQVCGMSTASTAIRSYFGCDQSFTNNQTGQGLLQCKVATGYTGANYNSCYLTYPPGTNTSVCCGCYDWWDASIGANSFTQSCGTQTNPSWNTYIQPKIQWMKNACPSVYTYPFDDKTSSFTCTNGTTTGTNYTGYIVTFCPGSSSSATADGMPSSFTGVNDGR